MQDLKGSLEELKQRITQIMVRL
ncbi:uncharacterized protein METZ01_LOCUS383688 [marine metagenome]|uniref:Uncharacterized protein n=1 Tax=marine metagenome TaxID=408172 RepID=A0A382U963_9ZZZZ